MLPPRHQRAAKRAFWAYWPRRILSERGIVALLLLAAVALLVTSAAAPQLARKARIAVYDDLRGVFSVVSAPAQKIARLVGHVSGLSDMSSDLAVLREENAKLKQWYDRALQLEAENRSLRNLVNLANLPRVQYVTARIIAESGSGFTQSIVVDAGKDQGVPENAVAMTGDGVIGRVASVSDDTAQVLLLTDVNMRIPAVIENSRHRGVLSGDNSAQPQLLYLPDDASVSVGERVLTSGHGGIFIPGLPLGVIVATGQNGVRIKPFADLRRMDFIQLVSFGRDPALGEDSLERP